MAQFFSFALVIISVVAWQIFFVEGCPARCVKNGGTCSFLEPTKCCTPICLAQYQVCGRTCAAPNAACVLSNDCCVPLACQNNVCCSAMGSTCAVTSDCCSPLSCANNVCCSAVGSTCAVTSDCCSPLGCENNVCCSRALAGSSCNSGVDCCSTICDFFARVCCIGPGIIGEPQKCCDGYFRREGAVTVCCNTVYQPCNSNGECCSNNCNQATKICECALTTCAIIGDCCNVNNVLANCVNNLCA